MLTRKSLLKPRSDRFLLTAQINRSRGLVTSVITTGSSRRNRSFRRSQRDFWAAKALPARAAWPGGWPRRRLRLSFSLSLFASFLITSFFSVDFRPLCLPPPLSSSPPPSSFSISPLAPLLSVSRSVLVPSVVKLLNRITGLSKQVLQLLPRLRLVPAAPAQTLTPDGDDSWVVTAAHKLGEALCPPSYLAANPLLAAVRVGWQGGKKILPNNSPGC